MYVICISYLFFKAITQSLAVQNDNGVWAINHSDIICI